MENAIEVMDLRKQFKGVNAVNGISFRVQKGELFGFLGINGAGKSTTINMLCTLLKIGGGSAKVCGLEVGKEDQSIRKRIGVVYQNNCLDDLLSVKENLWIRGALYEPDSKKRKENLNYVCDILDLGELLKRPFGKLSGGQKRKCELARALMNRPEILFLDEPTTGLDPLTRKSVWHSIEELRREADMTVFLTTHYMEEAARASHIAVIDEGSIKEDGTPYDLKEKYAKDTLRLIPEDRESSVRILSDQGLNWKEKEGELSVTLGHTMEAIPLLDLLKGYVNGFEVIQGTMDDVFLQITGKDLESA